MTTQTERINSNNSAHIAPVQAVQQSTTGTTWQIDPGTSRVTFAVGKRLLFVKKLTVTGRFAALQGTITLDEQAPANSRATARIEAASIDTQQSRRDRHLRGPDFFDVERHPTLRFVSRRVEIIDRAAGRYRVTGDLTIRDTTREVQLMVHEVTVDHGTRAPALRLVLDGSLNRHHFGLHWNSPLIRVGDIVTLALDVRAVQHT